MGAAEKKKTKQNKPTHAQKESFHFWNDELIWMMNLFFSYFGHPPGAYGAPRIGIRSEPQSRTKPQLWQHRSSTHCAGRWIETRISALPQLCDSTAPQRELLTACLSTPRSHSFASTQPSLMAQMRQVLTPENSVWKPETGKAGCEGGRGDAEAPGTSPC